MTKITDKVYCLETISKKQIYINKEQADKIKQALAGGQEKYITVEGQFIAVNGIDGIYTADLAREVENKKRGEYQCSFNEWHSRGQECGHNLIR